MQHRLAVVVILALAAGAPGAQAPPTVRPSSADFVAPGPLVPLDAQAMHAIAGLHAESLAAHIRLLASPAFEGRGLGGRGLEAAGEYAAAQLALSGIAPAIQTPAPAGIASGYFQPVPVTQVRHPSCGVRVESRREETISVRTFTGGIDAACPEMAPSRVTAPVVFAGYGVRESSPDRDDYRGLDVRGKIVMVREGLPSGSEWQQPALRERYDPESGRGRFAAKARLADAAGAVALIGIEGSGFPAALASRAPTRRRRRSSCPPSPTRNRASRLSESRRQPRMPCLRLAGLADRGRGACLQRSTA